MKKQIVNISPLQTAKFMAALWFCMSLPLLLFMFFAFLAMPGESKAAFGGMMIFMPILYAVMGFISTLIGAWIFNIIAAKIGGIEYTTKDIEGSVI